MTQFEVVLNQRLTAIRAILSAKEKEYATDGDRYHNFNVAARMTGETSEKALRGMMMKHIVSVFDLIDDPESVTEERVNEKIGDTISYLVLLEGMLKKRISEKKGEEWLINS